MRFALFLPPSLSTRKAKTPVLLWLSGLTCSDENFMQKSGALALAAELGWAILAPDTSPRGEHVPDDPDNAWDFGKGAGFYLNATQAPWSQNYQMYDYLIKDLIALIKAHFNKLDVCAISGHSMGGHGALTIGLKHPDLFKSISAFSPIVNPINVPWGVKAFSNYLGADRCSWLQYDACELLKNVTHHVPILIDQGADDSFLTEQLKPENLVKVALQKDYALRVDMHPGYDHSYYFVSSFINKHLLFHDQHQQT